VPDVTCWAPPPSPLAVHTASDNISWGQRPETNLILHTSINSMNFVVRESCELANCGMLFDNNILHVGLNT